MPTDIILELSPERAADNQSLQKAIAAKLGVSFTDISTFVVTRKSIDARRGKVMVNVGVRVFMPGEPLASDEPTFNYLDVSKANSVVVVGAGPAGLFAALRLIELGYKPIVIERGKLVSDRKRDIALLSRNQGLNPDSNYAFGE